MPNPESQNVNLTTKITKNTKTKIKYMTLGFFRELRVLRGDLPEADHLKFDYGLFSINDSRQYKTTGMFRAA